MLQTIKNLNQNFKAWKRVTRHFRRLAKRIAGCYYNDNRRAIKDEIRSRVAQVMKGWDLICQRALLASEVAVLAENSRRLESGLGELRVMA